MLKKIIEYANELTDEELGKLIKMTVCVIKQQKYDKTDNRIVNYLFRTQFKPAAERYIIIRKKNRINGAKGGRKKKGANNNGNRN